MMRDDRCRAGNISSARRGSPDPAAISTEGLPPRRSHNHKIRRLLRFVGILNTCTLILAATAAADSKESLTIPVFPALSTDVGVVDVPSNAATLQCKVARGMPLSLAAVAFSPDGRTLAVGGLGEVLLWDLAEAKLARRIAVGKSGRMVQAIVFTNSGDALAVGQGEPCASGAISVIEPETGQAVANFNEPGGLINCLTLSPDGKLLVAGCGDSAAYVWSLEDHKLVATLKDHSLPVLCAAFSADGKFLATGGADAMVQAWDTETWQGDIRQTIVGGEVRRCMIRRSDTRPSGTLHTFGLLIGGREDRTIRVLLDAKAQQWQRAKGDYHAQVYPGVPLDCVWLPKRSEKAFVACSDGTVKVFTEASQQLSHTATLRGHSDWVYGVALSHDATRLASASGDGTVKVWNVADERLLATLVQLVPKSDDWFIVTRDGWYTTSTPASVNWQTVNLDVPQEKLANLQNPQAVRQTLNGEAPAALALP